MRETVEILKRHFFPCLKMLKAVITHCPRELWEHRDNPRASVWQRVLHTLESIDYWFSDVEVYHFSHLGKKVSSELDEVSEETLSKEEMLEYFEIIHSKALLFFDYIKNQGFKNKVSKGHDLTYLDALLSQIRHIQVNIGYCSSRFNEAGLKGISWVGYSEE